MSNTNLAAPLFADSHLSAEQMYQYLEGHLSPASRHEVELHLVDCPLCADALDGLAISPKADTDHALFDLNRQVKSRTQRRPKNRTLDFIKDWGLATAILFLLILAAIIVWYQVSQSSKTAPVKTTKPTSTTGFKTSENLSSKTAFV